MSDQITYDDKADLIVDTIIDDMFKVSASDMNEIKEVVNANAQEMDDNKTEVQDDIAVINNNITDLNNNKLDINAVLNEASTDTDKTYSADYLNDKLVSVGVEAPTDGRRVWFKKSENIFKGANDLYNNIQNTNNFEKSNESDGGLRLTKTSAGTASPRFDLTNTMIRGGGLQSGKTYSASLKVKGNCSRVQLGTWIGDVQLIRAEAVPNIDNYQTLYFNFEYNGESNPRIFIRNNSDTFSTLNQYIIIKDFMLYEGSIEKPFESYIDETEEGLFIDETVYPSKPKVLWTNLDTTSEFVQQSVSLNESISNYNYYEVIYRLSIDSSQTYTSGKIPVGFDTRIGIPRHFIGYRTVNIANASATFSNHNQYTTYGQTTTTVTNGICIPYQVLGYKE